MNMTELYEEKGTFRKNPDILRSHFLWFVLHGENFESKMIVN